MLDGSFFSVILYSIYRLDVSRWGYLDVTRSPGSSMNGKSAVPVGRELRRQEMPYISPTKETSKYFAS